jgi:hypothetical protein
MADELVNRQAVIAEACALYRMLGDGNTIEDLRELPVKGPYASVPGRDLTGIFDS